MPQKAWAISSAARHSTGILLRDIRSKMNRTLAKSPARYPPIWPAEMRADVAAAFHDFSDVRAFIEAVKRGEAPRPTGYRGAGRSREPIWSKTASEEYLARRHGFGSDAPDTVPSIAADI